jgi:hypothetical protein
VIEDYIDSIVDYVHCPWVIEAAAAVTVLAHVLNFYRETYPPFSGNRNRYEWRLQ